MKHIIFEGLDRVGKDTQISLLSKKFNNLILRHFSTPEGSSNANKISWQRYSFANEFALVNEQFTNPYFNHSTRSGIIWNRSHIGEDVYGRLYREYDPDWIYEMENAYLGMDHSNIKSMDDARISYEKRVNTYLIFLYADADFLCENDDGESFTNDIEQKNIEIELFHKAIDKSNIINKIKIKVNDGKKFRDVEGIREQISRFIFNKQ